MSKKIISVFLIFAISLSMFALPVHAAEGEPTIGSLTGSFWQMLVSSSTDFVQYLFGTVSNIFNADAICPSSPDAEHHPGRTGVDRDGNLTFWCKYCNEKCTVEESVIEDAYQDYVETLPPGLNSGSTGTTKWGAGVQWDSSSNAAANAFWRTIDLYDLFKNASQSDALIVLRYMNNGDRFAGFRVELMDGLRYLYPGYFSSLSPYSTQNYLCASLYNDLSFTRYTVNEGYYIFLTYDEAYSYFVSSKKACYFLQPGSYFYIDLSGTYVGPGFQSLGYISSAGIVSTYSLSPGSKTWHCYSLGYNTSYYNAFYPLVETVDVGEYDDARPGSVAGNFGTTGDNGTVNNIGNQIIVNESDGTFYNPETGEYQTMESWQYDYATRTYNIVTGDGQTVTVTYGNENLTINNGDVTYNIYYMYEPTDTSDGGGSSGSGSGSGDSSGGGIFDKLGELLGTLGGGLVDAIGKAVEFLLDSLLRLARVAVDKGIQLIDLVLSFFERIPDMFGAFPQFLAAVFPFIPEEVMIILEFGLAAVVILGIIKILRK